MGTDERKVAVVTGASAGIGAAAARGLAAAGYRVIVGARRAGPLEALAREIGGVAHPLDVTDPASVAAFCAAVPERLHLLVNNAGGAHGLAPVAQASDDDWVWMFEANVLSVMRMTRALLPRLEATRGHVVNVTSIAGREVYPGGAGYTAAKHAAVALTRTLRLERPRAPRPNDHAIAGRRQAPRRRRTDAGARPRHHRDLPIVRAHDPSRTAIGEPPSPAAAAPERVPQPAPPGTRCDPSPSHRALVFSPPSRYPRGAFRAPGRRGPARSKEAR